MSEWLLEYSDVHFTYPGEQQPTLNGVSMRIPSGKKCVLLGHNGCGKSTLFLQGNGIYRPQTGEVRWKGNPLTYKHKELQQLKQKVGLVFQDPEQQLIASTVAEDISYGLCNIKLPDDVIKAKVAQIMDSFFMSEWAEEPIHKLSLGQKRRVALAGVMVLEPELMLLDEPTAYLDRFQTRTLITELDRIHQAGTTILLATHDLDFACEWADWIFVMDKGKIVAEGEVHEIFSCKESLERIGLGIPQVMEIWTALPAAIKDRMDNQVPRSVRELADAIRSLDL